MSLRRKCKLADKTYKEVDLRVYERLIIDTINSIVPNKNPRVDKDHFSTDVLTQSESVSLGRALAKLEELKGYGKTVTIFRLFDGKVIDNEEVKDAVKQPNIKYNPKGGRMS